MRSFFRILLSILILGPGFAATAADIKLEAKLVWGTSDDKGDANYKPIDAALAGKLHGMFKWKSYYEITNRTATIPLNTIASLKMSDQCTLRVKYLGASRVEVDCIGQGKQVTKGTSTLEPAKWLVLGGNCTNNTAWFIGLRAIDSKDAAPQKAISKN
ncbi:MAG: hypothetical protein ABSG59_09280 [Verrucomicrobiota bacterium]